MVTGTRLAYLRAINQIGLEAWVGLITIGLNIAFTVPLAHPGSARSEWSAARLGAYTIGSAIFIWRFNRYAPPVAGTPLSTVIRALAIGLLAGGIALGWGALMVSAPCRRRSPAHRADRRLRRLRRLSICSHTDSSFDCARPAVLGLDP